MKNQENSEWSDLGQMSKPISLTTRRAETTNQENDLPIKKILKKEEMEMVNRNSERETNPLQYRTCGKEGQVQRRKTKIAYIEEKIASPRRESNYLLVEEKSSRKQQTPLEYGGRAA